MDTKERETNGECAANLTKYNRRKQTKPNRYSTALQPPENETANWNNGCPSPDSNIIYNDPLSSTSDDGIIERLTISDAGASESDTACGNENRFFQFNVKNEKCGEAIDYSNANKNSRSCEPLLPRPAKRIKSNEFFCNLCSKSFCDNFFLKCHQASKHNISDILNSTYVDDSPTMKFETENFSEIEIPKGVKINLSDEPRTNADDFCDLCQKRFCNKYYLRKHKADVHGVFTGANYRLPKKSDVQHASKEIDQNTFQPILFANPYLRTVLSFQQGIKQEPGEFKAYDQDPNNKLTCNVTSSQKSLVALGLNAHVINANTSIQNAPCCEICGKQFLNQFFVALHRQQKHLYEGNKENQKSASALSDQLQVLNNSTFLSKDSNVVKNAVERLFIKIEDSPLQQLKQEMEENDQSSLEITDGEQSSLHAAASSSAVAVDSSYAAKLADRVTCDICMKEVCNKYFLKTHKLKVHGIFTDEKQYDSPSCGDTQKCDNVKAGFKSQNNDEIETVRVSVDTGHYAPYQKCGNQNNECTASNDHNLVENFPNNNYALDSNHYENMNGNSKYDLLIRKAKGSNKGKIIPQTHIRVFCELCNKDLCNKYFLRSHMLNVHGVSIDGLYRSNNEHCGHDKARSFSVDNEGNVSNEGDLSDRKRATSLSETICDENTCEIKRPRIVAADEILRDSMIVQSFLLDSDNPQFKQNFAPCLISLPVKAECNSPLSFNINLIPVRRNEA